MELGGIEIYTTDILPLIKKHFSVGLLLTHGGGRLVERIKKAGIPVYIESIKGALNHKRIKYGTKRIREISPRIVHTHNFQSHFSIRIASILAKIPVIIPHYHSMPGERFKAKTLDWEKILFHSSDRVLFVSGPSKQQFAGLLNICEGSRESEKLPQPAQRCH